MPACIRLLLGVLVQQQEYGKQEPLNMTDLVVVPTPVPSASVGRVVIAPPVAVVAAAPASIGRVAVVPATTTSVDATPVITVPTPTPSPLAPSPVIAAPVVKVKTATLAPLLDAIVRDVNSVSVLALHQYLSSSRNLLRLRVTIIANVLLPMHVLVNAGPSIMTSWDGKILHISDLVASAEGVTLVTPLVKRVNLDLGGFKVWSLTFTPIAGGTFKMSSPMFQDVWLSSAATATTLSLLLGTPTVFETWTGTVPAADSSSL